MPDKRTKLILKKTGDASTSLYSPEFEQMYHNPNGALAENRHVFFKTNGLLKALKKRSSVNIFEVGFGTGLHLLLVLDLIKKHNLKTDARFYSVEAFPIDAKLTGRFEFGDEPGLEKNLPVLRSVLQEITPGMNLFQLTSNLSTSLVRLF